MKKSPSLPASKLFVPCDFGAYTFKTTTEITDINPSVVQSRAIRAVKFAMGVQKRGYNLYAAGPQGLGKQELIKKAIKSVAAKKATPSEWCYVNNFHNPNRPIAIEMPSGSALKLQVEVKSFIDKTQQLLHSNTHEEVILAAIETLVNTLNSKYNIGILKEYLTELKMNLYHDIKSFYENKLEFSFKPYQINVVVDHADVSGAPIVYEHNPTFYNLFGEIQYQTNFGTVETNFNLIRAGALHKANGGYLILDANKVILTPSLWEALKCALQTNQIKIESDPNETSSNHNVSIIPDAIPLDVKIILVGSRSLYYLLGEEDVEFGFLFKVIADFDEALPRSIKNNRIYARLIASIVRDENIRHLSLKAVERTFEYSSRYIEDSKKLSLDLENLKNILFEADHFASLSCHKNIRAEDLERAIQNQESRMQRLPDLMVDEINRKYILIDVKGKKIGQVNGLTVISLGCFTFGYPVKISAIARIGRSSEVVNIDREVELSGALHSKGVLILSGYLRGRYSPLRPLSLCASIVFEQMYEGIDGDSASAAELCALLSAIAEIPLTQSIAVTGSVNQHGQIQAISGVNEKIEGFFDICVKSGLIGTQGVIIPESNVQNLMLNKEVIKAVAQNKFHIYPAKDVDEIIEILSGMKAGRSNKKGVFAKDTFNDKVEQRLEAFSKEVVDEKTGE